MKIVFDEKPQEIEVLRNHAAATSIAVRSNITEVQIPADEESGEPSRTVWEADEVEASGLSIESYEALVSAIIRVKYTLDAELAILRQRDSKPTEFAEYERFAEAAKSTAKTALSQ